MFLLILIVATCIVLFYVAVKELLKIQAKNLRKEKIHLSNNGCSAVDYEIFTKKRS